MFCGSRISASRRLSAPLCLSPAHRRPCIGSKRRPAKQNESQSSRRHRDRNHNQDHDIELGHPRFLRAAFLEFPAVYRIEHGTRPHLVSLFDLLNRLLRPELPNLRVVEAGRNTALPPGIFRDNPCIESNGALVDALRRPRYSRNTGLGTDHQPAIPQGSLEDGLPLASRPSAPIKNSRFNSCAARCKRAASLFNFY